MNEPYLISLTTTLTLLVVSLPICCLCLGLLYKWIWKIRQDTPQEVKENHDEEIHDLNEKIKQAVKEEIARLIR